MTFANFIATYQFALHCIAQIAVHSLELVGIIIIIIGSVKAIIRVFNNLKHRQSKNVIIGLGKSLSLALEFKMGAEIVNTVIVRDLEELWILAIVIALRAILALLIHWEIKNEKIEEDSKK